MISHTIIKDLRSMKKRIFSRLVLLSIFAFSIISCSNESNPEPTIAPMPEATEDMEDMGNMDSPEEPVSVVFNELSYGDANRIELLNTGSSTVDLSDFWLCMGPQTYVRIGTLTPDSGSITGFGQGEFLVLPYDLPDDQGGIGLYSSNAFESAEAMVDFVQYGAGGSVRESVAVEAGIWNEGDFVPNVRVSTYSIEFDGEGDMASDWNEEVNPSLGLSNDTVNETTIFNMQMTNAIWTLNARVFDQRLREGEAPTTGNLNMIGDRYQISFQAVPGSKLSLITKVYDSNDWFLSSINPRGLDLFPNGEALTGDISNVLGSVFDLGTEADNDPDSFPAAGVDVGEPDPNTEIRWLRSPLGQPISVILDYEAAADPIQAGTFILTITALDTSDYIITPGVAVIHAQRSPLSVTGATNGDLEIGPGLERLAEDGIPYELFDWFTEIGTNDLPVRLAWSFTEFAPGLVYAFNTENDPLIKQGEINDPNNGLEALAEDGDSAAAVAYLESLGIPVAASSSTTDRGPGTQLFYTLEVPKGQGYKLGFAVKFNESNDWFIAYDNSGFPLWDENGVPVSRFGASMDSYLYDSGTEIDEAIGFGRYQYPRQGAPNEGPEDENRIVRRVRTIEDAQFGKGIYPNEPGTVYTRDPRGGYNLFAIFIEEQ